MIAASIRIVIHMNAASIRIGLTSDMSGARHGLTNQSKFSMCYVYEARRNCFHSPLCFFCGYRVYHYVRLQSITSDFALSKLDKFV